MLYPNLPIGKRIEERIYHLRMKQAELAHDLNVEPPTVSNWIRGKRQIGVVDLQRIAKIIKVPMNYFFDEEFDPTMPEHIPKRTTTVTVIPPARDQKEAYQIDSEGTQTPITEETAQKLLEAFAVLTSVIPTATKNEQE